VTLSVLNCARLVVVAALASGCAIGTKGLAVDQPLYLLPDQVSMPAAQDGMSFRIDEFSTGTTFHADRDTDRFRVLRSLMVVGNVGCQDGIKRFRSMGLVVTDAVDEDGRNLLEEGHVVQDYHGPREPARFSNPNPGKRAAIGVKWGLNELGFTPDVLAELKGYVEVEVIEEMIEVALSTVVGGDFLPVCPGLTARLARIEPYSRNQRTLFYEYRWDDWTQEVSALPPFIDELYLYDSDGGHIRQVHEGSRFDFPFDPNSTSGTVFVTIEGDPPGMAVRAQVVSRTVVHRLEFAFNDLPISGQ
jgi:hypothetical protein